MMSSFNGSAGSSDVSDAKPGGDTGFINVGRSLSLTRVKFLVLQS